MQIGHPGASSQEGILPPHSLKSTSIELLISIPHLLSNPVLSFLELPKESILEFWNKGSESESSIEKSAFTPKGKIKKLDKDMPIFKSFMEMYFSKS